jgi:arylamine N-acetyltransferase
VNLVYIAGQTYLIDVGFGGKLKALEPTTFPDQVVDQGMALRGPFLLWMDIYQNGELQKQN